MRGGFKLEILLFSSCIYPYLTVYEYRNFGPYYADLQMLPCFLLDPRSLEPKRQSCRGRRALRRTRLRNETWGQVDDANSRSLTLAHFMAPDDTSDAIQ